MSNNVNDNKNVSDVDAIDLEDELLEKTADAVGAPGAEEFVIDEELLSEIEAIQDAIAGSDQPIEDIETAAGLTTGDGGSSSAVEFARDGAETIASTEFETEGFESEQQAAIITETNTESVNTGPTIAAENGAMNEDDGSVTVSYTAADVDGVIVSTTATVPAEQGTVTINETDGTVTFTPAENFNGDATITFVTTDNDGATAATTSTITVADINDGPTITAENATVAEDSSSVTATYTAADVDGVIVSTTATVPAEQGTVTINETDGTYTFTPAENFNGDATITFVTTDDDGATATTTSTVDVTNTIDTTTVTLSASDPITEAGGDITYTATLSSASQGVT
ncbi:tandem-95 repeat protein, partial [Psychromonas aquimarina]|uniref:tandem-95 repeat protein n=1 Tax=Psychromonas aquimarina TaxID=444919 RepID=UPI00048D7EE8